MLKATDREPQRRYRTAGQFADDLQAFLDGKPIAARRVGVWERTLKWAKRRPAVAALTVLVVLVGAVGIAGIVWQWRKTVAARDRLAVSRQGEAEAHAESEKARVAAEMARARNIVARSFSPQGSTAVMPGAQSSRVSSNR